MIPAVAKPYRPTAHVDLAEVAATLSSSAPPTVGVEVGTCFHALPFHRAANVLFEAVTPTAYASRADTAASRTGRPARRTPLLDPCMPVPMGNERLTSLGGSDSPGVAGVKRGDARQNGARPGSGHQLPGLAVPAQEEALLTRRVMSGGPGTVSGRSGDVGQGSAARGRGSGDLAQDFPFQRRVSVAPGAVPPIAQMSSAETAAKCLSGSFPRHATFVHDFPFQCTISAPGELVMPPAMRPRLTARPRPTAARRPQAPGRPFRSCRSSARLSP